MRAELAMGAARAAASLASGEPPPVWKDKITTEVRNRAVHGGVYPTVEIAEALCSEVVRVILEFERMLNIPPNANAPVSFHHAVYAEELQELHKKHPNANPTFHWKGHFFDLNMKPRWSLAEHIAEHRRCAHIFTSADD